MVISATPKKRAKLARERRRRSRSCASCSGVTKRYIQLLYLLNKRKSGGRNRAGMHMQSCIGDLPVSRVLLLAQIKHLPISDRRRNPRPAWHAGGTRLCHRPAAAPRPRPIRGPRAWHAACPRRGRRGPRAPVAGWLQLIAPVARREVHVVLRRDAPVLQVERHQPTRRERQLQNS